MSDIVERIASLPPEKRALFAARVARAERPARGREQIPRRETAGPAPLSYTQQSVWFLDQLYAKNVAYNSPIAVHLTGRLDSDALEWSWNQIICRHDLLRTVFELHQGDPAQYPTPFRPIRLRRMDFGDLAEPQRMEAARREAVRQARQPFNLVAGQLWRAKLLCCCSEREHVFVVIFHHIICDGWSIGILVREVPRSRKFRSWALTSCVRCLRVSSLCSSLMQSAMSGTLTQESRPAMACRRKRNSMDRARLPTSLPRRPSNPQTETEHHEA